MGDNPVARDIAQAVALAPAAWTILAEQVPPPHPDPADPQEYPVQVRQGLDAVEGARRALDARGRLVFTRAPEVLIVDAGGAPRDATFLQAHKSLQHAVRFVAPGSSILWIARCAEGYGSEQLQALAEEDGSARRSGPASSRGGDLHLQTICALGRAVVHARVALWSELPAEQVRRLGLEPLANEEEARSWLAEAGGRFWGWLPRAERFVPASGWRGGGLG
jgi:hypothetical protein